MFRQPSTTFILSLVAIGRGIVSLMRITAFCTVTSFGSHRLATPDIILNSVAVILYVPTPTVYTRGDDAIIYPCRNKKYCLVRTTITKRPGVLFLPVKVLNPSRST